MSGEYLVTVAKQETREVDESLEPNSIMAQMMKAGPIKSLIPAKYQAPAKSGFKVTIDDASPEPLKLDLKD